MLAIRYCPTVGRRSVIVAVCCEPILSYQGIFAMNNALYTLINASAVSSKGTRSEKRSAALRTPDGKLKLTWIVGGAHSAADVMDRFERLPESTPIAWSVTGASGEVVELPIGTERLPAVLNRAGSYVLKGRLVQILTERYTLDGGAIALRTAPVSTPAPVAPVAPKGKGAKQTA